jgi:hypothetical protein
MRIFFTIAACSIVVVALYMAKQYGQPQTVTFLEALQSSSAGSESEQQPKFLIDVTITAVTSDRNLEGIDSDGEVFKIEYTGSAPEQPFLVGQKQHFLGHVHEGSPAYFHATQQFKQ